LNLKKLSEREARFWTITAKKIKTSTHS